MKPGQGLKSQERGRGRSCHVDGNRFQSRHGAEERMATEEGGAGLQKPWQMGRQVHESKHLQRFIKNLRKDCYLKSRYLPPNHLTFK